LDSTGSGQGPVAGCCECGDEPSGSCATELVTVGISYEKAYLTCRTSLECAVSICLSAHMSHSLIPDSFGGFLLHAPQTETNGAFCLAS
jgi:hypothetical protein